MRRSNRPAPAGRSAQGCLMPEMSGSDLFPAPQAKRRRSSPSWLALVATVSTCAALAMAFYIGLVEHRSTPRKQALPAPVAQAANLAAVSPSPPPHDVTTTPPIPALPQLALLLSSNGDFTYDYRLTLDQLRLAFLHRRAALRRGSRERPAEFLLHRKSFRRSALSSPVATTRWVPLMRTEP